VMYYNCGDWVESCTALVEGEDGILSMGNYLPASAVPAAQNQRFDRNSPPSSNYGAAGEIRMTMSS